MIIETIIFGLGITSGILISKKLNKTRQIKNKISKNFKFTDIPNYWQYKLYDKLLIARNANNAYQNAHEMENHLKDIEYITNNTVDVDFLNKNTYEAKINKMSTDLIEVTVDILCRVPYDMRGTSKTFYIKPVSILKNLSLENRIEKDKFNSQEKELTELISTLNEIYK